MKVMVCANCDQQRIIKDHAPVKFCCAHPNLLSVAHYKTNFVKLQNEQHQFEAVLSNALNRNQYHFTPQMLTQLYLKFRELKSEHLFNKFY